MAYYAALISLVQLLEDIIHHDRHQNLLLDKQQIASVYEKFSLLQILLDDYPPRKKEEAGSLQRRITDAAYLAQDIIESNISNQMPQYLSEKNQMPDQYLSEKNQMPDQYLSEKNQMPDQYLSEKNQMPQYLLEKYQMSQQILELKLVKEEVHSIAKELMRMRKSHTTEDDLQLNYYSANAGTSNQASGSSTVEGFEDRLTKIKDKLCGEPSKLRVVSIVGMGGIGKTTLARNIFDDELIVYRFDCRVWVTVSQDYHQQKVLLDILHSMKESTKKSSGVGELREKIYKHLKGRRYLIIMDDMWDTKVWDDMRRILPDDSNGSRIMITTRISDVAFYVDRFGFYHQMQFLNENQSWNLFCEKVFCPSELEDIGRLIAKNCRGLPLAIVVVAGLLAMEKKTQIDWEKIARNVTSAAAENDERFSKILSLSYDHLPHHLKPCLLYIGGFPEDHEIRVSRLIKLWVADGFLKPIESKSLEAVAEEYLEDLVNRNLVLVTKKTSNGKIKCCGIHDLLRDLCMEIISFENFLHVVNPDSYFHPTVARNVRRLFIGDYLTPLVSTTEVEEYLEVDPFTLDVRAINCHTYNLKLFFSRSGFKQLRVLIATEVIGRTIPNNVLDLFHLKYLAIAIHEIPPSISLLQNLQTLIIEFHFSGTNFFMPEETRCLLPSEIRKMPNLRHIMSHKNLLLECELFDERVAGELCILENLQTLNWVTNVSFTNEVIEMIPNIRKLKVGCYEEAYIEWQKFHLDNLFHLQQLEILSIYFRTMWRRDVNPLPESFAFPLTLKNLSLRGCGIPWKDMTVVGSLPNLQVLKLRNSAFVGEKWEPVEGEFPQLKFLLMEELELKYWQAESTHFPALQHLKISFCENLQDIPSEIGEILTLELVEVHDSKLAAKSAQKMKEVQHDMGNDILQVQVYSSYRNFSDEEKPECDDEKKLEWYDEESKWDGEESDSGEHPQEEA